MDDKWKDWDVVETVGSIRIPAVMILPGTGSDIREVSQQLVESEWEEFVDLLNEGDGYERLLTLRENMQARKEKLSKEVEKWEDRKDWLEELEKGYFNGLQALASETSPPRLGEPGKTDPEKQLDSWSDSLADRPIVEAFVDFNEDGRLEEWPDMEDRWKLSTGNMLQGPTDDTGDLLQTFGYGPGDVDARRENTTVRYCLSDEELKSKGIDPENLESPRTAIQMEPTTSWDDALDQIKDKMEPVLEEMRRPKNTIRVLDFRLRILENVLYRFETFGSTETLTEEEAEEAARKAVEDNSTPETWEKNAAMMHAFFSHLEQHEQPDYLNEIDERMEEAGPLDSFSYEHTWKTLQREEWASSKGSVDACIKALKDWAPEFEERYGYPKCVKAAKPFDWPPQKDVLEDPR